MANHEAVAAFPVAPATVAKQLARDMAFRRMSYVVSAASEVPSLVCVDPVSGAAILVIICLGKNYLYDSTDTTTAHDGTTCLVSSEGRRYKLVTGLETVAYSVINVTTTAPPGSPAVGDAYLAATASTGAWAGHDNQVAVYTARGWEFIAPAIGRFIYDRSTDAYYHKNSSGVWTIGFGAQAFTANSVPPSALISRPIRWIAANATTNAPPATPAVGDCYIIGPAPTGAWAGLANKIALCEVVNTFTIYTPRVGELAFNVALLKEVRYSGTSWVTATNAYELISTQQAAASANIDFVFGSSVDDYDSYELVMSNLKFSADGTVLKFLVGTGAGPTYQTTSYASQFIGFSTTGGALTNVNVNGGSTYLQLSHDSVAISMLSNAAGRSYSARINFDNPELTDLFHMQTLGRYITQNGNIIGFNAHGFYNAVGPITAFRILPLAGNIASGRFSLYGRRKS